MTESSHDELLGLLAIEWLAEPGASLAIKRRVRLEPAEDYEELSAIDETILLFLKAWLLENHDELASHNLAVDVHERSIKIMKTRLGR